MTADYERGFIDGMQKQMQSSVDKAVNAIALVQKPMHPEIKKMYEDYFDKCFVESSLAQRELVCAWRREDDDHMPDTWRSDCGVMWTFTDGSPVDNDMKYCCGCGAMLLEKKT